MKTYPINLVLEDRLVILIGGQGEIAHKIPGLLEVGAQVRVIASVVDDEVMRYAKEEQIEWLAREFQAGDLAGASLIFAFTGNSAIHDAVWHEGTANGQLVCVMDVLPQCNVHGVSVVRRGQLTIAIGTGGAAPALAVSLRKRFEAEFGPEYAEFLEYAQTLRPMVAKRIPRFTDRKTFWHELVQSNGLDLLRNGEYEAFDRQVDTLVKQYSLIS